MEPVLGAKGHPMGMTGFKYDQRKITSLKFKPDYTEKTGSEESRRQVKRVGSQLK